MSVLSSQIRDTLYLLVHNKLPTKERTFHVGISNNSYCHICPGNLSSDLVHFFCTCVRVKTVWVHLRSIILHMIGIDVSDWKLINFMMPTSQKEKEVVWLLGNYVAKCWQNLFSNPQNVLNKDEFFGFLKFKYRNDQQVNRECLSDIQGL